MTHSTSLAPHRGLDPDSLLKLSAGDDCDRIQHSCVPVSIQHSRGQRPGFRTVNIEGTVPLTVLAHILDLRLLIARAGERDSLAWWDSHALTEQGQWALSRLYPRYAAYAGARLAIEAASAVHRKAIGHRPAVTLFGLGADLDARGMRQLALRQDYDVVLMNPPYGDTTPTAKKYLERAYPDTKNDLYAAFIERALAFLRATGGYVGAITSRTFMFLKSFRKLRENVIFAQARMHPVADLGFGVLDTAMVETVAFVLEKG